MPSVEDAHAALLRDGALQFILPGAAGHPAPPPWLPAPGFGGVGAPSALAAAAVLAAVALAVLYRRGREPAAGRPAPAPALASPGTPVAPAAARLALGDADGLAARGLHLEAARALLRCGVDAIAERHPGLLRPATTSRDLAGAAALPEATRRGFARIARAVELGLFGGRPVGAGDYDECRRAFLAAAFAPAADAGAGRA